jgi:hypothetical protein
LYIGAGLFGYLVAFFAQQIVPADFLRIRSAVFGKEVNDFCTYG